MKKTILIVALSLLLITTFIAPVLAKPPEEQKIPVTINWAPVSGSSSTIENKPSDGLSHRLITNRWNLELYIGDAQTPLIGTATCTRHVLYAFSKLQMGVYQDDYVITFASEGGGFEGRAHLTLYDYVSSTNYNILAHALFKGTGAFEGQTLNVGVDRGPSSFQWEGYLLKP